jgi:hypothetical protein
MRSPEQGCGEDQEMHVESVEIYSDATNAAIMRHPGRHFPGVLVQGDTLYLLCCQADEVCSSIGRGKPGFDEANEIRSFGRSSITTNPPWTSINCRFRSASARYQRD